MAKKGSRVIINLKCTKCGDLNKTTNKNKTNTEEKLNLKVFCPRCNQRTDHNEKGIK